MVLSLEQACDKLGCKRTKVFELLKTGQLEAAPRIGRNLRIYEASVIALLTKPTRRNRKPRRAPSPAGFELEDIPLDGAH